MSLHTFKYLNARHDSVGGGREGGFREGDQTSHSVVLFLRQHIIDLGFETLKQVYHGSMSEQWVAIGLWSILF